MIKHNFFRRLRFLAICPLFVSGTFATQLIYSIPVGYAQTQPFKTFQIKIQGMVCAFCSQGLIKSFKKQTDVLDFQVDIEHQQATVKVRQGSLFQEKEMTSLVEDAGLKAISVHEVK